MKKNYIAPSVEAYLLDESDIITTSITAIADGEYGVKGGDVFGA